jgi:hypothetical protein
VPENKVIAVHSPGTHQALILYETKNPPYTQYKSYEECQVILGDENQGHKKGHKFWFYYPRGGCSWHLNNVPKEHLHAADKLWKENVPKLFETFVNMCKSPKDNCTREEFEDAYKYFLPPLVIFPERDADRRLTKLVSAFQISKLSDARVKNDLYLLLNYDVFVYARIFLPGGMRDGRSYKMYKCDVVNIRAPTYVYEKWLVDVVGEYPDEEKIHANRIVCKITPKDKEYFANNLVDPILISQSHKFDQDVQSDLNLGLYIPVFTYSRSQLVLNPNLALLQTFRNQRNV